MTLYIFLVKSLVKITEPWFSFPGSIYLRFHIFGFQPHVTFLFMKTSFQIFSGVYETLKRVAGIVTFQPTFYCKDCNFIIY